MSIKERSPQSVLESPVAQGTDAAAWAVAQAALQAWERVFSALSPVIGQQGVAALYKRALYLSRGEYTGLAALYQRTSPATIDLTNLQGVLSTLGATEAAAVQALLGQRFADLLSELIGAGLADRLLHPLGELICPPTFNGPAAKDPSP